MPLALGRSFGPIWRLLGLGARRRFPPHHPGPHRRRTLAMTCAPLLPISTRIPRLAIRPVPGRCSADASMTPAFCAVNWLRGGMAAPPETMTFFRLYSVPYSFSIQILGNGSAQVNTPRPPSQLLSKLGGHDVQPLSEDGTEALAGGAIGEGLIVVDDAVIGRVPH